MSRSKKKKRPAKRRPNSRGLRGGSSGNSRTQIRNPIQTRPREDRHKLVALVLASLIAGLLMVINCDRVTHANRVTTPGASEHGWPWVYLKRELAEMPDLFIHGRTYSWPYPPIKGEIREMSYPNLILDLVMMGAITLIVYFAVSTIVSRYDSWRYSNGTS